MSTLRKAMKQVVTAENQKPLRPCKNGHIGVRYKCGKCVECEYGLSVPRAEYMREYMRDYRAGKRRRVKNA